MGTVIVLAISNLACIWLTAFIIQRVQAGRSVVPSLPSKVSVENDNGEATHGESEPARGRMVV